MLMQSYSEVLQRITLNEAVELTSALIKIPSESPPGREFGMADLLEQRMKNCDLEIERYDWRPERPNLIGWLRGRKGEPTLMLNGHTDTVPIGDRSLWTKDPLGGTVQNGKIFGRGAADMKGGLAAMFLAAKALKQSGVELKGDLMVADVCSEEGAGAGTEDLIRKGYRADAAMVGEPTELRVHIAHKGALRMEVTTIGKSAHSSNPPEGINAIYKMSKICLSLEFFMQELKKKKHILVGNPSVNVGTIEGGTTVNIVPNTCTITIDRRLIPGEDPAVAKREIDEILETLKEEDPELQYRTEVLRQYSPSETPAKERIVTSARKAATKVLGQDPGISGFGAGCDMRALVHEGKIPTVILGPGSLEQAHKVDEFIKIRQVLQAAKIYALVALDILG